MAAPEAAAAALKPSLRELGERRLMTALVRTSDPQIWIDRIFEAKIARDGGVVRRSVHHVHREIGRQRLELEVRRRGFHLLQSDGHYIIVCNSGPLALIC